MNYVNHEKVKSLKRVKELLDPLVSQFLLYFFIVCFFNIHKNV